MKKRNLDIFAIAGTVLMVSAFTAIVLAANAAAGQAATQPALVAPVASGGAWAWFLANASWVVPLIVSFLASLATGLSDYPKAAGAVKVIRIVVAALGVVQFRDAPGSIKAPFAPPAKA